MNEEGVQTTMETSVKPIKKMKLYGFNNLTKTLSFNIYDICYTSTEAEKQQYIEYIDEVYNAQRLTDILTEVSHIIGANVLNIAKQDYDPQGASVTILISEEEIQKEDVVCHLDKSHLTVHTYPESHPYRGISTFRADIDVSTCGQISPLKALNYLIGSLIRTSSVLTIEYAALHVMYKVKNFILITASTQSKIILMQKPRTCTT